MPRIKTKVGWRWESKGRKVFIGLRSDIYAFHVELWRFSVCLLAREKIRQKRKERRRAS